MKADMYKSSKSIVKKKGNKILKNRLEISTCTMINLRSQWSVFSFSNQRLICKVKLILVRCLQFLEGISKL